MYFLQNGVIEIYIKMENGQEFILEKLFRGSIINYRTFFMEEGGKVYYRFARDSILSMINNEKLLKICESKNNHLLKKKFTQFSRTMSSKDKIIPLDYIMTLPKHLRGPQDGSAKEAWTNED